MSPEGWDFHNHFYSSRAVILIHSLFSFQALGHWNDVYQSKEKLREKMEMHVALRLRILDAQVKNENIFASGGKIYWKNQKEVTDPAMILPSW